MFVSAILGKIEVEHVISKKLQLKRKAEVCKLGLYLGNHLAVFNFGDLTIRGKKQYSLFFSTLRMTWCVSWTVRSMTSWTVSSRSRPAWSLHLYLPSSHLWCPTRRKINSGAAWLQASGVREISGFISWLHLFFLAYSGVTLFIFKAIPATSWPRQAFRQPQVPARVSYYIQSFDLINASMFLEGCFYRNLSQLCFCSVVSCLRSTTSGPSTTCSLLCSFYSSSVRWWLISLMKAGKVDSCYFKCPMPIDQTCSFALNLLFCPKLALTLCLPWLRLVLDFNLLVYAFGKLPLVVCTWICMFLSVLLVPFTLFHLWSQSQSGSHGYPRMYSLLFASLYLLYQGLGLGFLPMYVVVTNSLPPASCFIIIMEQVSRVTGPHIF